VAETGTDLAPMPAGGPTGGPKGGPKGGADRLRAASPLAGRGALFGERVALAERPFLGRLNLRAAPDCAAPDCAAMTRALAELAPDAWPPPTNGWTALAGDRQLAWLGPDEALLLCQDSEAPALAERLRGALEGAHAAVTDVSDGATCLRLSGPAALDVLAKGCPLDLEVLPTGSAVQTLLAHLDLLLLVQAREVYDLHVRATLAAFAWDWLADAAEEFL